MFATETQQYKYEQSSENFDMYQRKYEARQAAKQKALDKCDYTLVDKLTEDDASHIHSIGDRLVKLGMKLGVGIILSFCQLGESSLLTFPETSTLEEGSFVDAYQELVSITMAHYLQPRVQLGAVERPGEDDAPQNESHAANLEDVTNSVAVDLANPLLDTYIPTEVANDFVPLSVAFGDQERDSNQPLSGVGDPATSHLSTNLPLDDPTSFSNPLHNGSDDMDHSGSTHSPHSSCIPSRDINSFSRCNGTEQGLWITLKSILSAQGLEIGLHFSPCDSLIPPLPSPLPLGDSEVAMQVSLIFAQLFALCWIRGFRIELHCLPSNPTCKPPIPPIPSAPAKPFVLKSIPIQRGWWADQVRIQEEARKALGDPISFSRASTATGTGKRRRWSPYPVMKSRSSARTVLAC